MGLEEFTSKSSTWSQFAKIKKKIISVKDKTIYNLEKIKGFDKQRTR